MAFTRSFATTTPNIIIVYTSQLCFNYLDFANHKLSVVVVVVCVYTRTPCASRHLFIYFSTQGYWRQPTRRSTAPKSVLNSQTQSLQRTCKKLFLRLRCSLFIVCIFKRAHFQPPPPPSSSASHLRVSLEKAEFSRNRHAHLPPPPFTWTTASCIYVLATLSHDRMAVSIWLAK